MSTLKAATGAGAVFGGVAWMGACLELASLPEGCVGDECVTQPQRDWSTLATSLSFLGFGLMAASAIGMLLLALRASGGRRSRLARAAALVGAAGVALLVTAGVLAALGVRFMDDAMPGFVVPGLALCVVSAVLTAWLVVQTRVLPLWVGVVLAVAAAVALGANEQKDTILVGVPLGAAWLLAGVVLLLDAARFARAGARTAPVA
ncbi:hypothetical protein [Nocardioides sp. P5_E3]